MQKSYEREVATHLGSRVMRSAARAFLPKARAGCGSAACPDPWRGLCAIMIPTPTSRMKLVLGNSVHKYVDYFEIWRRKRNTFDYAFSDVSIETEVKELLVQANEFYN